MLLWAPPPIGTSPANHTLDPTQYAKIVKSLGIKFSYQIYNQQACHYDKIVFWQNFENHSGTSVLFAAAVAPSVSSVNHRNKTNILIKWSQLNIEKWNCKGKYQISNLPLLFKKRNNINFNRFTEIRFPLNFTGGKFILPSKVAED